MANASGLPPPPAEVDSLTHKLENARWGSDSSNQSFHMPVEPALPRTLLDLVSNYVVLRQLAPYLSVSAIYALQATSKSLRSLMYNTPEALRYMDLSMVKSAKINSAPTDVGGVSWRSERMDEALTEDEFYSGPIRGIFSKLARQDLLRYVSTLVLDGLSVPADMVREIISEDRFNVRILSLREARNLNERKLMQLLRYVVRPSRPEGTPKLRGLYIFGAKDKAPPEPVIGRKRSPTRYPDTAMGVMSAPGAQIGAEWNHRSQEALSTALAKTDDKWYQPSGRMVRKRPVPEWAEILQACEGIIHFDAVLCRGPRHAPEVATPIQHSDGTSAPSDYLPPTIATIALGPSGCAKCGSCPEGPAIFGQSPSTHLPLLSPPPLHSSTVRAAQTPTTIGSEHKPLFFARCEGCLKGRWCERCNKWWDEGCYQPGTMTELQTQEMLQDKTEGSEDIKIMGSKRECFGCGETCAACKSAYIRPCRTCSNEYCVVDNDGSSDTTCDWCNYSGRRTRELY